MASCVLGRALKFVLQTRRPSSLHRLRVMSSASSTSSLHDAPVVKRCKLIALADPKDAANAPLLEQVSSIPDLDLLAVGVSLQDFDVDSIRAQQPNAIFVSSANAREPLAQLLQVFSSIEWIHSRSAGIDHIVSPALLEACSNSNNDNSIVMTNAKGLFSSTLAEYTMMACAYFAKDLPRILRQQRDKDWTKFPVRELKGTTMGVVGYGDIGAACARLAKAYGMRVVGLKRSRKSAEEAATEVCDNMYYTQEDDDCLNKLFCESDFVVCAAPLTEQTRSMIGKEALDHAKPGAVFVNVGRGPVVDEVALIAALESGNLRGAGLDVVATEPLPKESRLWELDNVLLSPHNMDMTETFMHESTEWFVTRNIPRFVRGLELENKVDPTAGY